MPKRVKESCPYCNKKLDKRGLITHIKFCDKNPKNIRTEGVTPSPPYPDAEPIKPKTEEGKIGEPKIEVEPSKEGEEPKPIPREPPKIEEEVKPGFFDEAAARGVAKFPFSIMAMIRKRVHWNLTEEEAKSFEVPGKYFLNKFVENPDWAYGTMLITAAGTVVMGKLDKDREMDEIEAKEKAEAKKEKEGYKAQTPPAPVRQGYPPAPKRR